MMEQKTQRPDRSNVQLRHRVEELEDQVSQLERILDETRKRTADLEEALAVRVGYETAYYSDQPRAAEVPYPR